MRVTIPNKINKEECRILNIDLNKNSGTHWVCYYKNKNSCYYFELDFVWNIIDLIIIFNLVVVVSKNFKN